MLLRDPGLCGLRQTQGKAGSAGCRNWCLSSHSSAVQLEGALVCVCLVHTSFTVTAEEIQVCSCGSPAELPMWDLDAKLLSAFKCSQSSVQISWASLEISAARFLRLSLSGFLGCGVSKGNESTQSHWCVSQGEGVSCLSCTIISL